MPSASRELVRNIAARLDFENRFSSERASGENLFPARSTRSPSIVGENVFLATKRGSNFYKRFINATFISVKKSRKTS